LEAPGNSFTRYLAGSSHFSAVMLSKTHCKETNGIPTQGNQSRKDELEISNTFSESLEDFQRALLVASDHVGAIVANLSWDEPTSTMKSESHDTYLRKNSGIAQGAPHRSQR